MGILITELIHYSLFTIHYSLFDEGQVPLINFRGYANCRCIDLVVLVPREDEMAELFRFSDEQWACNELLLPSDTRGLKRVDDRRVLSGIMQCFAILGCHWSHCPREYGPPKTIYNRFVRWAAAAASGKGSLRRWPAAKVLQISLPLDLRSSRRTEVRLAEKGGPELHAIGLSVAGRTTESIL